MQQRLQKLIANAGLASRRKAEEWIQKGRVTVNGDKVTELGAGADPDKDEVRVDGKLLPPVYEHTYIMLHKPEGYVTTTKDPQGRPTVMGLVKKVRRRIYPAGRLDYNTSGLLLLTSDGDLTKALTHPSSSVPKTYYVKVKGRVGNQAIQELRKGPDIGGGPLQPSDVRFVKFSRGQGSHSWIEITITEGRTRQIRRMCKAVGHPVMKLKRTGIGPLKLGSLQPGDFRPLTDREVSSLKKIEHKKAKPGRKSLAKRAKSPDKKPIK